MARRLLIPILLGLAALSDAARAGAEEERLLVAVPDDWTIVPSVEQGQVRLEQFLPPGQSVDDWVEMVMVVTHLGAGGMDPAAAASALVEASEATCGETAMAPPGIGEINGRPMVALVLACRDPKPVEGVTALVKRFEVTGAMVIQGLANLYFVQRSWHGDEAEADLEILAERHADIWAPFFRTGIEFCETGWLGESCAALE